MIKKQGIWSKVKGVRLMLLVFLFLPSALCLIPSASLCQPTKFGVLVNGTMTTTDKIAIANSLGVKYIRNEIKLEDWTGSSTAYEKFRAKFQVLLNLNWGHAAVGAVQFPTNLPVYASKINAVLTKYPTPALVVLENEETNSNYHDGPITDYIAMLDTGIDVVHSKGLKVTDGGIHPQGVCYWVYQDYLDRSLPDSALWWKNETFSGTMQTGLSNPAAPINAYWREIDTLLNAFTTLDLDYVNLHIYEPLNGAGGDGAHVTANSIKIMADYILARTGKQCITNESGQHNLNDTLVTSMLTAFCNAGYPFAIWFDGDGLPARALNESNGTLRSNGVAFRDFVNAYNADSTFCGPAVDTSGGGGDSSSLLPPGALKGYTINADSTILEGRTNGNNELQIKNATRTTIGFLVNNGSGITKFKLGIDSVWSAGSDTIKWRYTNGTISYKLITGGGGSTDTTSLSNRINLKVNISDTAAMLLPYLRKTDTTAMLSVYLRKADTASLSTRINLKLDSVTRSHDSVYQWHNNTKVFAFIDSTGSGGSFSTVFVPDWAVNDSIAVADTANYTDGDKFLIAVGATGMIATHDNQIGTWHATVDTFSYQTASAGQFLQNAANGYVYQFNGTTWDRTNNRTPIHQGLDSLGAPMNIGTSDARYLQIRTGGVERLRFLSNGTWKITKAPAVYSTGGYKVLGRNATTFYLEDITAQIAKYSDTATMLSVYLRKVDTSTLSNRINLKVNISDTATMLSVYLRKADTSTLSNRINLKVNISDTAAMLTPYLRKTDTTAMLSPYMRGLVRSNDSVYGVYASGNVFKYKDSFSTGGFIKNQYASRQAANFKIDTGNATKFIADTFGIYSATGSLKLYALDTSNYRLVIGNAAGAKSLTIFDNGTSSTGNVTINAGTVTLGRVGGGQILVNNALNVQSDASVAGGLYFTGSTRQILSSRGSGNIAGKDLSITAGSSETGASNNLNGGDLVLSSGLSEGSGTSNIYLKTAKAGSSGVDNTPANRMAIFGSGSVQIKPAGGAYTEAASAILELQSTTQGLLLPRMTKTQRDAISSPATGLAIYQTDNTPGLRVYNGTNWMRFTETAD